MFRYIPIFLLFMVPVSAWGHPGHVEGHATLSTKESLVHHLFEYPHAILAWAMIALILVFVWHCFKQAWGLIQHVRYLKHINSTDHNTPFEHLF